MSCRLNHLSDLLNPYPSLKSNLFQNKTSRRKFSPVKKKKKKKFLVQISILLSEGIHGAPVPLPSNSTFDHAQRENLSRSRRTRVVHKIIRACKDLNKPITRECINNVIIRIFRSDWPRRGAIFVLDRGQSCRG